MLARELNIAAEFPPVAPEAWRKLVDLDLKGAPFERKLVTHTYEGIYVKPLYTSADWPGEGRGADASGFSGVTPFVRGGHTLSQTQCGWDVRQERAEPRVAALNEAILDDLAHGVTSVVVRLDAAGRAGMDPDDARAGTLVGNDGCAISTLVDLRDAFKGVYLDMIGVWLEAGAAFVPAAGLLASAWENAKIAPAKCRGGFNADPLAVLARDGALPYSWSEATRLLGDLASWTSATYPNVKSVRVGTAPYHHGGATATQDLAFSMATGLEYLRALTASGLSVEKAAEQMVFSYAVGCQFFLASAKLRAARRLWARIIEASGGDEVSQHMTMHVRPSKRVITTRDPWVNLLRNTACVFAAGVGGADAIGSVPFDAGLGVPSPLSRRIARNTALILQEECHLHRVSDPAGGCWFVESLTEELAERAWVILQAIESRGGMAACLKSGWIAEQIDSAFAPRLKNLITRKDAVTGVSEFPNLGEALPVPPATDPAVTRHEAKVRVKANRGNPQASDVITKATTQGWSGAISAACQVAAKGGASMGQMFTAIGTKGETVLPAAIAVHPFGEAFERLRSASDEYQQQFGVRPRVFLASMGSISQHTARTSYAQNFFEAGGFEVIASDGYSTSKEAATALLECEAEIAVICGSDASYETLVPELAPALHKAGARTVVLAGNPGEKEAAWRAAGIDRFIFVRCDVVGTLSALLKEEGALL